jgi:hypothetical protein
MLMVCAPAPAVVSEQQPKPAAPGTAGDPPWNRTFKLSDGRTFVTDGGIAIDAALAKPPTLPNEVPISTKIIEGYLASPRKDEYGLGDLKPVSLRTYTAPSGIVLNSTYINYLRRILPARSVRLRMTGDLEPVQIVVNDKTVGVLMPVKK